MARPRQCPKCRRELRRRSAAGVEPGNPRARVWRLLQDAFAESPTVQAADLPDYIEGWECTNPDCLYVCEGDSRPEWILFLGGQTSGKTTMIAAMFADAVKNPAPWTDLEPVNITDPQITRFMHRKLAPLPTGALTTSLNVPNQDWLYQAERKFPATEGTIRQDSDPNPPDSMLRDDDKVYGGPSHIPLQPSTGKATNPAGMYQALLYSDSQRPPVDLLLIDMPGEMAEARKDYLLQHAPALLDAPLVILCLDPRQLLEFEEDDYLPVDEEDLTNLRLMSLIPTIAKLRKRGGAKRVKAPGHIAVVVTKADRLESRDRNNEFPHRALERIPYGKMTSAETLARLIADSDLVRTYLQRVSGALVARIERNFTSCSFHLVTATGCEANPDDGSFPHISPRRVRDPILLWQLRAQLP